MIDEIKIAKKADEVRGAKIKFPIDPIVVAKSLGVQVFTASLPRNVSGQIFYAEKKIFIEQTDFITRQTFSVAHELGHFILHNDGTSHTSPRNTTTSQGIDIKEIEANCFAANLLMPKDEVLHLVGLGFAVDSMANYFGVSSIAMQYHLNNLGVSAYV